MATRSATTANAAAQPLPEAIELSGHCLLRLMTALLLEAGGIHTGAGLAAMAELNRNSGRDLTVQGWIAVLEPSYRQLFMPGDPTPLTP